MKYLLIALLNTVYGVMLLVSLSQGAPGFFFVLSIAVILTTIGVIGCLLWAWGMLAITKGRFDPKIALKSWYKIVKNIDILLVLGLLFRAFVLQPFLVDGNSMEPNFQNQEYLLVDQITYRFRPPKRGEVIIFHFPRQREYDYIKRVIGLPGEKVGIKTGRITINGRVLEEPYLPIEESTLLGNDIDQDYNKTLGENEYFVLGDNRGHSSDSREWGIVPRADIIGRAWLVVTPLKNAGLVKYPELTFQTISPPS